MTDKNGTNIISFIGVAAIVVFLVLLIMTETKKEDLCLCQGARTMMCADREDLQKAYLDGRTEYIDLAKLQDDMGGPKWSTIDFGIY